jgi:hypothetical protein
MQTRERKLKNEEKKEANVFFRLELETKEQYDSYCKEKGFSLGKRLRSLIKADIQGKILI